MIEVAKFLPESSSEDHLSNSVTSLTYASLIMVPQFSTGELGFLPGKMTHWLRSLIK